MSTDRHNRETCEKAIERAKREGITLWLTILGYTRLFVVSEEPRLYSSLFVGPDGVMKEANDPKSYSNKMQEIVLPRDYNARWAFDLPHDHPHRYGFTLKAGTKVYGRFTKDDEIINEYRDDEDGEWRSDWVGTALMFEGIIVRNDPEHGEYHDPDAAFYITSHNLRKVK